MDTIERKHLGEALQIIADFYRFPDEEFYQQLFTGHIQSRLKALLEQANLSLHSLADITAIQLPQWTDFKQEYIRTMMAGHGQAALPIESVYKIWTIDKSAKINIAQQKEYLMGDSAVHISHLLEAFGLEIPNQFKHMPDHLTILLELLAFFLTNHSSEEVNIYVAEHFDWLMDFKAKLEEVGALSIYIQVTNLLIDVLEQLKLLLRIEKQHS